MPLLSTLGAASARSFGGVGGGIPLTPGLDIPEVFSIYIYRGAGSGTSTIANGIDLSGEGGLIWIKSRTGTSGESHLLVDTERGGSAVLQSNSNGAANNFIGNPSFLSNGFSGSSNINDAQNYVSWTFRKAPKFFDVVTYTGDGTTTKTVSHNLGTTPGAVFFKRTDDSGNWTVWHRSISGGGYSYPYQRLNGDYGISSLGDYGNNLTPTSSVLRTPVHTNSGNTADSVNVSGASYVAYVFAHNNSDGEFGPLGDQDIIKCGSYSGGSNTSVFDIGFEPQWMFIKKVNSTGPWYMFDDMRGMSNSDQTSGDYGTHILSANTNNEELNLSGSWGPRPKGFAAQTSESDINSSGNTYVYIAVRKGQLKTPTTASSVFKPKLQTGARLTNDVIQTDLNGFDLVIPFKRASGLGAWWPNRLTDFRLQSSRDTDNFYGSRMIEGGPRQDEYNYIDSWSNATNHVDYAFKRANGFFDMVVFKGDGSQGRAIDHNLGVSPEFMLVKKWSGSTLRGWYAYHTGNANQGAGNGAEYGYNFLNTTDGYTDSQYSWNETAPTKTQFTVGGSSGIATNDNGSYYIAYLWATAPGVSKVGSYTGAGAGNNQNIDCGFSSGSSLVMIKRTSSTGSWYVWDSARGINAAGSQDPYLQFNNSDAEGTNFSLGSLNSGFTIVQDGPTDINLSGSTYIFLAIAAV